MRSKLLLAVEVTIVAAIFFLDYRGILPVSKTPYLFLLGWDLAPNPQSPVERRRS
jgi:hypothetical protein